MVQVKLTKPCSYGKKGDVVMVSGNVAHGIFERGEGENYKPAQRGYRDRMMETRPKRVYKRRGRPKRVFRRKSVK